MFPEARLSSPLRRHLQSLRDLYSNGSLPTAAKVGDGKFGICSHVRLLEKAMAPTPVLLPRKSHGQRSLVDCSPWGS